MDYSYEQLGPEKFQQFCQALLIREKPDVQCFPVAQPDAGRDAISRIFPNLTAFVVYQIKFVRNAQTEADPHKWLVDVLEKEAPKLRRLVPKGASQYFLLTNVSGTAHGEVGSIDRVQKLLSDSLDVPAVCWWRDDLSRRLDSAWDLKWDYPELMTGPDLVRAIVESGLREDQARRTSVISAYVRDQYDRDKEVRFKQVELQNLLLDLFIDVPIEPRTVLGPKRQKFEFSQLWRQLASREPSETAGQAAWEGLHRREERSVDAATMLLNPAVQAHFQNIVVEGAPGQGKSTVTQYICQVHRMRILKLEGELKQIPAEHRSRPVRIPVKVDLRDLAAWLGKRDPFSAEENAPPPQQWTKTLESFVAAQIRHYAGGGTFTVDDLLAVCRVSALLLVFDGLDEVADITRRRDIVDEITRGVSRLRENATSIQVVVTSRPAAFANSPGMPEAEYLYLGLTSLTRASIEEYAAKWLRARRLSGRDSADFRKILREKLDQPHLRDLARNPMQLAILLSLLQRRGASLPDKRTALYASYIDVFLGRESEKSTVVREHRDLLIDVHQYLAWRLQAEAELGRNTGSITVERLQLLLREYLSNLGHDTNLVDALFQGIVERVFALVSRVQGTFEFEVQPLREYFAAQHLYVSAPYSPTGDEKHGTLTDRFDALARNFYWLNVTRFYSGSFDKGELPALAERLQELSRDAGYRRLSHPRVLAATLLADWVFAQNPISMKQVISLVLDGIGLRYVVSSSSRRLGRSATPLVLPKRNGNEELLQRCISVLRKQPPRDYALDVIDVLKANASAEELSLLWQRELSNFTGHDRARWLQDALAMGVLPRMSDDELLAVLDSDSTNGNLFYLVFRARQTDFIEQNPVRTQSFLSWVLDHSTASILAEHSVLSTFIAATDPRAYESSFKHSQGVPLEMIRPNARINQEFSTKFFSENPALASCAQVIDIAQQARARLASEWATMIAPWDSIAEALRSRWGDCWRACWIASAASSIKSSAETAVGYDNLFDNNVEVCRRARYARLRAGAPGWWKTQFSNAKNDMEHKFVLLLAIRWCSASTLVQLINNLENALGSLDQNDWEDLHTALESHSTEISRNAISPTALPEVLSPRLATALTNRMALGSHRQLIFQKYLKTYDGTDHIILAFCADRALRLFSPSNESSPLDLRIIQHAFLNNVVSDRFSYERMVRDSRYVAWPISMAEQIMDQADQFPAALVGLAEAQIKAVVAKQIVPVGRVAEIEKWSI